MATYQILSRALDKAGDLPAKWTDNDTHGTSTGRLFPICPEYAQICRSDRARPYFVWLRWEVGGYNRKRGQCWDDGEPLRKAAEVDKDNS